MKNKGGGRTEREVGVRRTEGQDVPRGRDACRYRRGSGGWCEFEWGGGGHEQGIEGGALALT